jgi:hypothetical protein
MVPPRPARHHHRAATAREAADWSRGRIIATNLRAVLGRAYPRIVALSREPSWIFFEILLPFLAVAAFVLVYRALGIFWTQIWLRATAE